MTHLFLCLKKCTGKKVGSQVKKKKGEEKVAEVHERICESMVWPLGGELNGLSITRINILDAGNCSSHTFDLSSPVAFLTVISEIQRIYRARGF